MITLQYVWVICNKGNKKKSRGKELVLLFESLNANNKGNEQGRIFFFLPFFPQRIICYSSKLGWNKVKLRELKIITFKQYKWYISFFPT